MSTQYTQYTETGLRPEVLDLWSRSGPRSSLLIQVLLGRRSPLPWSWSRSGPRSSLLIQVLLGRIPGWHLAGVPPQQDTCPLPCSSTTVPQQRCWSSPSPTTHTSSILRRRTSSPPPSLCPHPPHLPLSPSQHRAPGNQSSILRSGPGPDLGQQPNQIWSKS